MKLQTTSIRLPPDLVRWYKELAEKLTAQRGSPVSASDLIRRVLHRNRVTVDELNAGIEGDEG